jgi:hypothetical protein
LSFLILHMIFHGRQFPRIARFFQIGNLIEKLFIHGYSLFADLKLLRKIKPSY